MLQSLVVRKIRKQLGIKLYCSNYKRFPEKLNYNRRKSMILAKLKEATRPQHDSLEGTVDIMNRAMTLEGYKNLLCKFYSFHAAIEQPLGAIDWQTLGFDFESRRKRHFLEKDFQYLDVDKSRIDLWRDLPEINDAPQAVGCLYVLEGSTLGGQVISRHLRQNFDLTPANGAAFFNSYGERVGEMWKAFGAFANNYAEAHADEDETIINAARQTFTSFEKCFKQPIAA